MTNRKKLVVAIERAKEQSEEYGLDRILVSFKAADMVLELLKEQPDIIRCKDCMHWLPDKFSVRGDFLPSRCERNNGIWAEDAYCSQAERRSEG